MLGASVHEKICSYRRYHLGLNVRQREGAGGFNHQIEQKVTYFSKNDDDIQS